MTRAELGKKPTRAPSSPMLNFPAGFRFYPTDEELIVHYLCRKADSHPFPVPIIAEIELYKFDPWDLPERALFGEREWYFFSPRDRKYPNGSRPNRAAGTGYWKATGTDKPIGSGGKKVGVKKALVFYKGKAPKGVKTNWIMHEYRLATKPSSPKGHNNNNVNNNNGTTFRLDDWVLCRIYKKSSSAAQKAAKALESESSSLDERIMDESLEIDEVVSDALIDEIPSNSSGFETRATTQNSNLDDSTMLNHLFYQEPRQSSSSHEVSHLTSNDFSSSPLESSSTQEDDSVVNSNTLEEFPMLNANTLTSISNINSSTYCHDFGLPSPSSMLVGNGLVDSDFFFSSFSQLFDHRSHLMM